MITVRMRAASREVARFDWLTDALDDDGDDPSSGLGWDDYCRRAPRTRSVRRGLVDRGG